MYYLEFKNGAYKIQPTITKNDKKAAKDKVFTIFNNTNYPDSTKYIPETNTWEKLFF